MYDHSGDLFSRYLRWGNNGHRVFGRWGACVGHGRCIHRVVQVWAGLGDEKWLMGLPDRNSGRPGTCNGRWGSFSA